MILASNDYDNKMIEINQILCPIPFHHDAMVLSGVISSVHHSFRAAGQQSEKQTGRAELFLTLTINRDVTGSSGSLCTYRNAVKQI